MKPPFWRTPLARVLFLFLLGIILPTAFLVYLGLHSIRAETALLRKQAEERMGETAASMRLRAQEAIAATLKPYEDFIQSHRLTGPIIRPADRILLKELQRQQKAQTLLLLDSQDRILFPFNEYPTINPPLPELPERVSSALRKAENLEFRGGDVAGALREYEAVSAAVKEPRWKALLLMRMAGCLVKLKEDDRAQGLYQQVAAQHGKELNENGDPLGLLAASQIAMLARRQGRPTEAALHEQKALRDLLTPRWPLTRQNEDFHGQRLSASLQAALSQLPAEQRPPADEIVNRWKQYRSDVEHIADVKRRTWGILKTQLIRAHRLNAPTILVQHPKTEFVIYTPAIESGTGQRGLSLVATLTENPLIDRWSTALQPLAAASQMSINLQSPQGQPWLATSPQVERGHAVWDHTLEGIIPAIRLQISELRDWPVERTVANRQKIYLAMVALAALVIGVALYTVWFAVSREMEIAQLKAGFVASVSHELKTPLSIITLIGQKLKLKRYQSTEEVEDYYSMLGEETERLKGLIDEVLDFSRLLENRKPYTRRETDLANLVDTTLDRCLRSASTDNVQAEFKPERRPFSVFVDPAAIERVVINLIDNAIKYSPSDRVRISLSLKNEGTDAVLAVADQGDGIPADEIPQIFERFFRGRSASQNRNIAGVGLGLSIVQHIVEGHDGTISVVSGLGEGSCFTIRFPLKESA